jgi:hypothetical protein
MNACGEDKASPIVEHARAIRVCQLMGCYDQVDVTLSASLTRPDEYRLEVLGSTRESCKFKVPVNRKQLSCSENLELRLGRAGEVLALTYYGRPQRLVVVLKDSAGERRAEVRKVAAKEVFPNGPDCEPSCLLASHEIELSQD